MNEPYITPTEVARYYDKARAILYNKVDCWLPRGVDDRPRIQIKRKRVTLRRFMWFKGYGFWPRNDEMVVAICGEPDCHNPEHLTLLSKQELADILKRYYSLVEVDWPREMRKLRIKEK